MLSDSYERYKLRQFILWDIIDKKLNDSFKFDSREIDWHIFGDVLLGMRRDTPSDAQWCWNNIKEKARTIVQNTDEFDSLILWVDKNYLPDCYKNCQ